MTKNAKIAVALVGGYLLGRTKKAKMAMGLGLFLAGKKLDLDPRRLGKLIADSPALDGLNQQVRTELVEATRSAATEALTQRAAGLATSLARRTEALDAPEADTGALRDDDESDARDERDEDSSGDERDDRTARRKTSGSSGGETSWDSGRTPAKRARSAAEDGARRTGAATRRRTGSAKSGTGKTGGTRSGAAKKKTTATRKSGGDDHA